MKPWVQDELQSENVTFFIALRPPVSWANSRGTVLDVPMDDDGLICNVNDPLDGTFRCRMIPRKKARTTSARLRQLATWEEENRKEATATDRSD